MTLDMYQTVEAVHIIGYLHRDIKPDNFRVHDQKVYLTDFGLIKEFKKEDDSHIAMENDLPLNGTLKFASVRTHQGFTQSRRDDMEQLAYTILSILTIGQKDYQFWFAINDLQSLGELSNVISHLKLTFKESPLTNPARYR